MVLQELLQIGLGGAAVAILYVFDISYILLAICCLFVIHAISQLWITNQTEKLDKETRINFNAITVTKDVVTRIQRPNTLCSQTTDAIVDSDFVENSNGHQDFQNDENTQQKSEKPDVIPHKQNRRDEYHTDAGSGHYSEVTTNRDALEEQKDSKISKAEESTTNHMHEKDTKASTNLPLSNAEAKQIYLEKSEVTHHKKTGRDEYHNDGRNTNNIEVVKERHELEDEKDGTLFKVERSTNMDKTFKIEEEQNKSGNFEKTETVRSASLPTDVCSNLFTFLESIGLDRFYPNKLKLMDAMKIQTTTSLKKKDVALRFVKNIVMINCTCRDQLLHEFLENTKDGNRGVGKDIKFSDGMRFDDILDEKEGEDETEVNPLDLLFAIFKCSNLMLKQILANKLFMCKLAIPFILPSFEKDPTEMCLWPLRSIILESKFQNGSFQDMSVECPCEIVSFVRIGRPSVSKSKLLNEILTDQYHNTFSNKDCPLGTLKRAISDGMVEAAWYIPSNKSSILKNMTMFLNLRGDGITHTKQLSGVSQLADIVVVMVIISDLESKVFTDLLHNILESSKRVVVAVDAFQNKKKDVKQKLQIFTKSIERYQQNINISILSVEGQVRSTSFIKSEMRKAISGMMMENVEESLYKRVHKCEITTDEEDITFRNAKQKAFTVLHNIPKNCLNLKEAVLPLQGETWASWSHKLKKVNKTSKYKNLQEEGLIKKEMIEIRQKQMKICEDLGPFMKNFLTLLSQSIQSDENCTIFVLWLKHFLDQRSRSVLPANLSQYQSDWQALKTSRDSKEEATVIQRYREALEKSERNLAEASFGFEHLCREMGQIFESIDQCNPEAIHLKKLAGNLPLITAKLLAMGHPFEIMDGDVANVPLVWVRAVLEQVREILGEKKLLALSVLGIQSSGKSTLLNTMFGLQFAVSAGRCTRGVFIQLVPVNIENSKFDYVLVIDTEGLRAPELAYQKHSHDNELATFVIGLGDITVVNIKGENTAEMKDVLQIAVHAFLRLKLTSEKLNLKQTCIFVHQNVPASDANDKMMQGRQKFVEVLDEMTKEAAEQENIADIQSFNQVIDFDSEKNVWYFSDLWHGDPPMAPANPGYSESVNNVKEAIMGRLTLGRNTYLTITDTTSRIEDLWNGILKDDFVFSFRNSLELKAYNSMDQQCQLITWKLEKYVLEYIKSDAKSKLVSCENEDALENAVPTIMVQLCKEVDLRVIDLNHELNSFVEKSTLKDIMVQWTQAKRNRLTILAESLIMKAKTAVNNTKEELRIQKLRVSEKTKHEIEINNMAKQLALQMKGQVPKESVLREKFNTLWNSWIDKFTTHDVRNKVPIKEQIEATLYESFASDATFLDGFIDKKRRLPNPIVYQNMKHLEGTLTTEYISTRKHLSIHKLIAGVFWRESTPETCKKQAIDLTNMIFRQIDIKLTEHNTEGIRFDPSYVTEILYIAAGKITDFNLHTENDYKFNLLPPFRAMIFDHVVRYATVFFTRLNDVYNKKKSPKAQMEEYKGTAWELFKNTVENKTEDVIALGFFRDAMVKVVVDQVSECLPIDAQESIQILFANGKYSLIKDILIHLAKADDFKEYKSFIQDPYIFARKWIKTLLDSKLFEKHGTECLYTKSAKSRVSKIFLHLSKCIAEATNDCIHGTSNSISEWIDEFVKHNFKSPDLPLSNDVFVHVRDRKISDLETFTSMLTDELLAIESKVVSSFSNDESNTVQWRKNPVPNIMDNLWGCSVNCMFCKEPCMNTNKNHVEDKFPHKCLQHRPNGIGGFRSTRTNKMVVNFCNYLVSTDDRSYSCRGKTKEGKYKNYKENFPDWDIPPNSDISKYWMWVICKYRDQLTQMYDTDDPDIPENWWLISKEEALDSL